MKSERLMPNLIFATLVFFIVCYPLQLQSLKMALIAVVLLQSLFYKAKLHLSSFTLISLYITVVYSFSNLVYHSFFSYSPLPYLSLYVAAPIIYLLVFGLHSKFIVSKNFFRLLALFSAYISIININSILLQAGSFGVPLLGRLSTGRVGIHDGYTQIVDYNIYSLFFLGPMLVGLLLYKVVDAKILMPSTLLTLVAIILSGRRALWLAFIVSIVAALVIYTYRNVKLKNRKSALEIVLLGFFLIAIVCIAGYAFITNENFASIVSGLQRRLVDAFTESGGLGVRAVQQKVLIDDWLRSPLFGNGIAVPASIIRSSEFSTAYEASYHALISQTGLMGALIYGGPAIYVLGKLLFSRVVSRLDGIGATCGIGLLSILIGIYSNPYFGSFDGLWMLFLPVIIYNHISLVKDAENTKEYDGFTPRKSNQSKGAYEKAM